MIYFVWWFVVSFVRESFRSSHCLVWLAVHYFVRSSDKYFRSFHNFCLFVISFVRTIHAFFVRSVILLLVGGRIITVHGRTKEMRGRAVASCDWEAIRRVKEALPVPVFSNGGIASLEDVDR